MSHFVCYVLAGDVLEDAESNTHHLLEPFNENLEVEGYEEECWCRNNIASREAREKVHKTFKSLDILREEFNTAQDAARTDEHKQLRAIAYNDRSDNENSMVEYYESELRKKVSWDEFTREYHELFNKYAEEHPKYNEFDPECDECEGGGTRMTTYNPESQWDWYRIGGRWDGAISGLDSIDDESGGFNFGDEYQTLERNCMKASDLLQFFDDNGASDRMPYAMVTQDGGWLQRGSMGWFGMGTDELEEDKWHSCVKKHLEENPESYVVACDLHI